MAAQLFGGLDILTVDAIIEAETGKVRNKLITVSQLWKFYGKLEYLKSE